VPSVVAKNRLPSATANRTNPFASLEPHSLTTHVRQPSRINRSTLPINSVARNISGQNKLCIPQFPSATNVLDISDMQEGNLEPGLRRRPGSNNVTFDRKPLDGVFGMHSRRWMEFSVCTNAPRYLPRSGWAEQKTSRESCCGKTAIHHACQPEFRRAKNCRFAPRRLGQKSEAKRVRRSLPVSRQSLGRPLGLPCRSSVGCLDRVVVNLLLMHGAAVPSDHFATSTANTRIGGSPFAWDGSSTISLAYGKLGRAGKIIPSEALV
jgi:hypothetical protein